MTFFGIPHRTDNVISIYPIVKELCLEATDFVILFYNICLVSLMVYPLEQAIPHAHLLTEKSTCKILKRILFATSVLVEWARHNVDYVIHTGDLIDFQSRANFDLVRKYWGDAMFGSMGNHEFYSYLKNGGTGRGEEYKNQSWEMLKAAYPMDPRFASRIVNGVNFIAIDDVFGSVQPDQVEKFKAEAKKGLPMVLCMHVPFFTPHIEMATYKFWRRTGKKFVGRPDAAQPPKKGSDLWNQRNDPTTAGFIAYLKEEKQLKAILSGHEHMTMEERFSPTAVQYLVGGNFLFAARELLFV